MSIKSKYDVELDNKNYKEALKIINELLGKYLHIVGNGQSYKNESDETVIERSNAHTIDWEGNAWFAGDIKIGGTGQDDTETKTLATTTYTDNAVAQKSQVIIITWEADD